MYGHGQTERRSFTKLKKKIEDVLASALVFFFRKNLKDVGKV